MSRILTEEDELTIKQNQKKVANREDPCHQKFKEDLLKLDLKEYLDFEQYTTGNPDYIFLNSSLVNEIIGEVKRKECITSYKLMFKELRARKGKQYDVNNYDYFFTLTEKYISIYKTKRKS